MADHYAGLDEITRRREYTRLQWKRLEFSAAAEWPRLERINTPDIPEISRRACIYVTGSMAREEATESSDLDLFAIDGVPDPLTASRFQPLSYVEACHLISALDDVRLASKFRPFSRGGEFIVPHSFESLISEIGSPADDASNTFTARILLLLNSRALLNHEAYSLARAQVLDSYWTRGEPDQPFLPIMLTNDIRRWWGVLGLNFELANRRKPDSNTSAVPDKSGPRPAERRLETLKLRYAKLLSVYSVLIALIHDSGPDGLLRVQAERIFDMTPVQRLISVATDNMSTNSEIASLVRRLLESYDKYLQFVSPHKEEMLTRLTDEPTWEMQKKKSYEFHKYVVKLFQLVGGEKTLYEYCVA